jgi:indolepyruvate ferredoxin oxidoreductase
MNHVADREAKLRERYDAEGKTILLTGVQALVRLMLVQAKLDRKSGLHTGGFVSGYRGSPLGTLDRAFQEAADVVRNNNIVVRPAINEEMAATAIAGTQQVLQSPGAKVDGVFSLWYGKGPGFDRASDAIRHGNSQGSSPKGGVVVAVGDDHMAKSSTLVCASDAAAAGVLLPLLYPSDASELIAYGLHGFALSRLTGSWVALKVVPDLADATHIVGADEMSFKAVLPPIHVPAIGLHNRWPDMPLEQEMRQRKFRLPGVLAYVRANELDKALFRTQQSKIGIIAAGKTWLDLQEALRLLGLPPERLESLGIALYKPALIWPLEPERLRAFGLGLKTLVIIEEKGPFLEDQVKAHLYGFAGAPRVSGKAHVDGRELFPSTGDINPERIALDVGQILSTEIADPDFEKHFAQVRSIAASLGQIVASPTVRKPFFCSGCPHNRSTVVPEGSRALAGIGCHGLAVFHKPDHFSYTQMGGEGAQWIGLAPFTDEPHIFANMGDGTYFHSGILSIRQAVAVNANITYKLLYNSAVAMTGGQSVDGELNVDRIVDQLRAEGVAIIAIVTEDLSRYAGNEARVDSIAHRDNLEAVQRDLMNVAGVSVIIFDQMCATEKRRLRKRGKIADSSTRVFINELVCEGCGDCSVQSNCLSVEPIETPFGTKRRINQSSCNKDLSCTLGFCPSFVTVTGAKIRKMNPALSVTNSLPGPSTVQSAHHQRILIAGIGGTGVVTIGALLSMSAHLTGRNAGVLDQIGLAQKGGAVLSHVHLAEDNITALRIPAGQADLILACDEVVANAKEVLAAIRPGHTRVLANQDVTVTSDFVRNRDAIPNAVLLTNALQKRAGDANYAGYPFARLSEKLFGDTLGANLMMIGFAYQKGWIAIDAKGLSEAILVNGAAVALNESAFTWGRRLALDPLEVLKTAGIERPIPENLDTLIERRIEFLTAYQGPSYSARFAARVARIRERESVLFPEAQPLTEAVARSLFKLMAYKDEYEVARLYSDKVFKNALAQQFGGDVKLAFHVAPPILASAERLGRQSKKWTVGAWMMLVFRGLAPLKRLRGTRFDIFGYTTERKMERALLAEFEGIVDRIADTLTAADHTAALAIAQLPMSIRGYGHVKGKAVHIYKEQLRACLNTLG